MEATPETFSRLLQTYSNHAISHYTSQSARSLPPLPNPDEKFIPIPKLPQQGLGTEFAHFHLTSILPHLPNQSGPHYFGLVTGGVTPIAMVADNYTSLYDQNSILAISPVHEIECTSISMLLELFQLSCDEWIGTITTGATASNILGVSLGRQLVCERNFGVDVGNDGTCGVKTTIIADNPHSSILKAAGVTGIGRKNLVYVDEMELAELEEKLKRLTSDGGVIVVLGFGEVNTGEFPKNTRKVAALCAKYNAHLHIDAAFGIYAKCSDTYKHLADGLELADTICADGHKWLNVPYDCGFFFYRRKHHTSMLRVFNSDANYLSPDSESNIHQTHPMNINLENSRRFRALPVYSSLIAYGKQGFGDLVDRNCAFAKKLHFWLKTESTHFEIVNDVECVLNIVLFRAKVGTKWRSSEKIEDLRGGNARLRDEINASGKLYVTGTEYKGIPAIRAAISNWRTCIELDWEIVIEGLLSICK